MKRVSFGELDFDDCHGAYTLDGLPFTGTAYRNADGRIASEQEYVNGLATGEARTWYPSGPLKEESEWDAGVYDGRRRVWNEEHRLILEEFYEFGICLRRKAWDDDGVLQDDCHIDETSDTFQTLLIFRGHFGGR